MLVYVTYTTISKGLIYNIYNSKYLHILILPKQVVTQHFYKVFIDLIFRSYIQLVIINKVYLILNQGLSFYNIYIKLFKLYILLSPKPQFIYIVTLDNNTFKKVCKLVVFRDNFYIIQTLINYPKILIIYKQIKQGNKKMCGSLYFIVNSTYKEAISSSQIELLDIRLIL